VISEPGAYYIHFDKYHNTEICPSPSISGSGLVDLAPPAGVAKRFWWNSTLNPNREPVDTKALTLGKAAHTIFLEGLKVAEKYFAVDRLPNTGEGSRKAKNAFAAAAEDEGRALIREADWETATKLAEALFENPLVCAAFSDGKPEQTLICQDPETGVWMRARPDWLPDDVTHLPELKTARNASQPGFQNAIKDYGYHIKAAHLMECCKLVGLGTPKTFTHYVIESEPPYLVAIHTIPRESLEWGMTQRRAALHRFAECLEKDAWPGYPAHAQETGLPVYTLSALQKASF